MAGKSTPQKCQSDERSYQNVHVTGEMHLNKDSIMTLVWMLLTFVREWEWFAPNLSDEYL